ncbi:methyltransferase [bacterium]|nr:methyltransferase [bacterium]
MDFPSPEIVAYSEQFSAPESELLAELQRETWAKVLMPRMLSGHIQGRTLSLLSRLKRPRRILEIGTYTGYSALCLAEGLAEGGVLHTIDINDELESMVRRYFDRSPFADRLHLHIGDATRLVPELPGPWDLVFIDADKENYAVYFDAVVDALNPGGLLVADNVLWSGKVLDDPSTFDAETAALHAFNAKVASDPRVDSLLLPVRDGLMCCVRL